MSNFEDFLRGINTPPGVRLTEISGEDLGRILSGDREALRDILIKRVGLTAEKLRASDCGNDDCPVHGLLVSLLDEDEDEDKLTAEELQSMTAHDAERMMLAATGAAHNMLIDGKTDRSVALLQRQADIWGQVADILRNREALQPKPDVPPVPAYDAERAEAKFATDGGRPVD